MVFPGLSRTITQRKAGRSVLRACVPLSADATAFETINLLDDRASYRIEVDYSRGNPITHERLYRMCLGKYMEEHETD